MIVTEAVAVYRLFGLNIAAIFALARILVTIPIILLTLRIPFKRNYHWIFLGINIDFLFFAACSLYSQVATEAATAKIGESLSFFTGSRLQVLLIFLFVVYFVGRRPALWEKVVLTVGFAYVMASVWVPLVIDYGFVQGNPVLTSTGWAPAPGTSAAYLAPSGVDIYFTIMAILIYFLLFRHYSSAKAPLVKGQAKYLIIGMSFIFIGSYQHFIQQAAFPNGYNLPTLQQLLSAVGDSVNLVGLRRKRFYSVVPTHEASTTAEPVKYPLLDSRTYLADNPENAFRAFSGLVKNGRDGLCVTRNFPDTVRKTYDLRTTPIRWLAEERGEDIIPPEDMTGLSLTVKDFISKADRPVVLFHGVEYLTNINGFTPVIRLLNGLSDSAAQRGGILIIPIVPNSLEKQEQALLTAETTPLPTPPESS